MRWYHVSLEEKKEIIYVLGEQIQELPIGSLLVAFLDVDWDILCDYCESVSDEENVRRPEGNAYSLEEFYQNLKQGIGASHPILKSFVEDQLIGSWIVLGQNGSCRQDMLLPVAIRDGTSIPSGYNPHVLCKIWDKTASFFRNFQQLKEKLTPIMDETLDAGQEITLQFRQNEIEDTEADIWDEVYEDDEEAELEEGKTVEYKLSQIQRYCLMRKTNPDYFFLADKLYGDLGIETAIIKDGVLQEYAPVFPERYDYTSVFNNYMSLLCRSNFSVQTFHYTDYLDVLLLWEIDYMATHELTLRRCANCNLYFVPRDALSRYCSRPTFERPEKTCKDLGPSKVHQAAVNADAAKKLYRKTSKRVRAWADRNRDVYPNANARFKSWNFGAQQMRDRVIAGELAYEEFAKAMEGNPSVLLGFRSDSQSASDSTQES